MLIVTQNYTETCDILLCEPDMINTQSNAVIDTGGKTLFICTNRLDGTAWFYVCAGDTIESEQITKQQIEQKPDEAVPDPACMPDSVCVLGTYPSMRHALSALNDILTAAGRGAQIFHMPSE